VHLGKKTGFLTQITICNLIRTLLQEVLTLANHQINNAVKLHYCALKLAFIGCILLHKYIIINLKQSFNPKSKIQNPKSKIE